MDNKEKENGKVALKQILNMMVAGGDRQEIINDQVLESLLVKLNEFVNSEENKSNRFANVTPERLEMFNARYGLDGSGKLKTYDEVAKKFNTTDVRARQAEAQVLRQLTSASFIPRDEMHHSR